MNHIEPSQYGYQLTQKEVFFKVEKVSLSYNYFNYWALRKWRINIGLLVGYFAGKIVFFLQKRCILTYPMQLWVLGRNSVEPITPGPSRRCSEFFRPARLLKLRKHEISYTFKSFCRFFLFSADKPYQTGQK